MKEAILDADRICWNLSFDLIALALVIIFFDLGVVSSYLFADAFFTRLNSVKVFECGRCWLNFR